MPRQRRVALLLGIVACLLIALLASLGYIAVREWEHSVLLLADRQAGEASERFLNQLSRDMQGVQRGVLLSPELDIFTSVEPPSDASASDPSYEAVNLVASAFARYSYPESFFLWRRGPGAAPTFFYRQERRPSWTRDPGGPRRFPVVMDDRSPVGAQLLDLIQRDAGQRGPFVVAEAMLDGTPYQIVARLFYRDPLRQNIDTVFGFLVNLTWARQHYFSGLLEQTFPADDSARGVSVAVFDDRGSRVAGSDAIAARSTAPSERRVPLMFFNPLLVAAEPWSAQRRSGWIIRAVAREDSTLVAAASAARRMLFLQFVAAAMLVAGIVLSVRAAGARLRLAELRSDFVASVTHEFKTPIATIRAAGETLAAGRLEGASAQRDYARFIVQEARRLTRLVDNLLAFSRLTDSTDVRQPVEPVVIADLVTGALGRFSVQLDALGFHVDVSMPETLPLIPGDPGALELMLDNIVDNAIRHSRSERRLAIRATSGERTVFLEVSDSGGGIPPDEIQHVTKKFFRGRHAGHGGTGLGLALAARVIADHGGTLEIGSEAGVGATIRIGLPAMPEDRLAALQPETGTEAKRGG
jgi:signal transduction histidine kinase